MDYMLNLILMAKGCSYLIKIMILVLANATNNETFSDTSSERNYETWLYSSPEWLRNNLFNAILFACYIYLAA